MKKKSLAVAFMMMTGASGAQSETQPDFDALGHRLCHIVDGYLRGSYHYFDCLAALNEVGKVAKNEKEFVEMLCAKSASFYGFSEKEAARCAIDGAALLEKSVRQ